MGSEVSGDGHLGEEELVGGVSEGVLTTIEVLGCVLGSAFNNDTGVMKIPDTSLLPDDDDGGAGSSAPSSVPHQ